MTLSEEEKARIRAEEIFRQEVRAQLEGKKNPKSFAGKVWSFVNTSFGIWLLSSLVVGLVTWGYTKWEAKREGRSQALATVQKLDTEIAVRMGTFNQFLTNVPSAEDFYMVLRSLDDPQFRALLQGTYPEYRERGVRSLLIELERLVPESERASIRQAARACIKISEMAAQSLSRNSPELREQPVPKPELRQAKEIIDGGFNIGRWRQSP